MAPRLTDKQKKKIVADYVECGSYEAAAKINGVAPNTVKKFVLKNADLAENLLKKKEENSRDILSYMGGKKDIVCEIITKGLEVLNDEKKLKEASPSQITTAIGTLIDKWLIGTKNGHLQLSEEDDPITKALKEDFTKNGIF